MTTRPGISPTDWMTLARYVSGEARPDERASLDPANMSTEIFPPCLFFRGNVTLICRLRVP